MLKKRRRQGLIFFLCILLLFMTGCAGDQKGIRVIQDGQKHPNPDAGAHHEAFREAETPEAARDLVLRYLEESDAEYKIRVRDYFYVNGEKRPGIWIFALSDLGEWLDVLISDMSAEELMRVVNGSLASMDGIQYYRKNEAQSYYHKLGFPHEFVMPGHGGYNDLQHGFTVYMAGNTFAKLDVDPEMTESFYWDGRWTRGYIISRPDPTTEPTNTPEPDADYNTYSPSGSIGEELSAMQERLTAAELGYSWEMRDSITVDGVEYPVVWMFAVNDHGEWVDAVFSEDPDFAYFLKEHRDVLWDLRGPERNAMNAAHPGREVSGEYTDEWIVQDVFYSGYSYYLQGHGMAIRDCGSPWCVREWSDELHRFTTYYDRDLALNVNYKPET